MLGSNNNTNHGHLIFTPFAQAMKVFLFWWLFKLFKNTESVPDSRRQEHVVGWLRPLGYIGLIHSSPSRSGAAIPIQGKNISLCSLSALVVNKSHLSIILPTSRALPLWPPQLIQHRLGHPQPKTSPSSSTLALFYSFAQICLCGKFTACTACLNYLKAQYSRLCHKAFPFCVFYFSVWGPFMKSAARRKEIICILGSIHLEFLNFRD